MPTGNTITTTDSATGRFVAGNKAEPLITMQGGPTDNADAGNYELVDVASVSGATITLRAAITKSYGGVSFANQRVVVQRVPQYRNLTVSGSGSLTAFRLRTRSRRRPPATRATSPAPSRSSRRARFTLGGNGIDVKGKGFRGGIAGTRKPEGYSGNVAIGGGGGGGGYGGYTNSTGADNIGRGGYALNGNSGLTQSNGADSIFKSGGAGGNGAGTGGGARNAGTAAPGTAGTAKGGDSSAGGGGGGGAKPYSVAAAKC